MRQKTVKNLISIFILLISFIPITGISSETQNAEKINDLHQLNQELSQEVNSNFDFEDSRYDEAKEIYRNIRVLPKGSKIYVIDVEAWKQYEYFMITSHESDYTNELSKLGNIRINWIPELNRHIGVQDGLAFSSIGCTGLGCEYGCCSRSFGYNVSGEFTVYYCCDCIDE